MSETKAFYQANRGIVDDLAENAKSNFLRAAALVIIEEAEGKRAEAPKRRGRMAMDGGR